MPAPSVQGVAETGHPEPVEGRAESQGGQTPRPIAEPDSTRASLESCTVALQRAAARNLSPLRERTKERVFRPLPKSHTRRALGEPSPRLSLGEVGHFGALPGATTTPTPTREVEVITEEKLEPPYALIIHNDPVNSMAHVIQSLMHCVPSLTHEEAFEVMMQAHQNGQARVTVAPHEEAARYRNCLESRGLTATIELAYD